MKDLFEKERHLTLDHMKAARENGDADMVSYWQGARSVLDWAICISDQHPSSFTEGDVVVLKSGGPKMTVTGVDTSTRVWCACFEEDKLHTYSFPLEALRRSSPMDWLDKAAARKATKDFTFGERYGGMSRPIWPTAPEGSDPTPTTTPTPPEVTLRPRMTAHGRLFDVWKPRTARREDAQGGIFKALCERFRR